MRNVYTIAFVGFISFTGLTAHAQPGGVSMDSVFQMLTGGGAGSSFDQIMAEVTGQPSDAVVLPTGPTIEGPLAVETVVPDVNQAVVEIIDTRTGRYPPRLTINFAQFQLRSLAETNHLNNGRNGRNAQTGTRAEAVAQRIQSRLGVPELQLTVEDRTAVISGTVATEQERRLIENMLRFEPGISRIQNEIAVVP